MEQLKKEKILVVALYMSDNGSIGIEFGDESNKPGVKQQLLGALEMFASMIKQELLEDTEESSDESERWFS